MFVQAIWGFNLRNDKITDDEIIEAAKMIGAHEFIMRLPGGYQYKVMERGATLSMGQRQLISFVRALVFNPDILILDEATSSIDPETESVIQFAIETLIKKSPCNWLWSHKRFKHSIDYKK